MRVYHPGRLPYRLSAYYRFRHEHLWRFETPPGGMPVILDLTGIAEVEHIVGEEYAARGLPRAWAHIGLLYEDPYLLLLREAVRFPDGLPGVHHRVVRRSSDPSGVAVLPLLGDRIVLIRHFRHPIRNWTWELPRGAVDAGETPEAAARREMHEEISARVIDVRYLGHIHGSTGLMGLTVSLLVARLDGLGPTALGEGIDGTRVVEVAEFEAMVRSGEISDAFTLGCFLQARLAQLI